VALGEKTRRFAVLPATYSKNVMITRGAVIRLSLTAGAKIRIAHLAARSRAVVTAETVTGVAASVHVVRKYVINSAISASVRR
jgi:hypothetical protein